MGCFTRHNHKSRQTKDLHNIFCRILCCGFLFEEQDFHVEMRFFFLNEKLSFKGPLLDISSCRIFACWNIKSVFLNFYIFFSTTIVIRLEVPTPNHNTSRRNTVITSHHVTTHHVATQRITSQRITSQHITTQSSRHKSLAFSDFWCSPVFKSKDLDLE